METIGLAVALELPLLILDIQRAGPATGMPTKPEQADLMLVLYGRHAESPVPVVAAATPGGCFDAALEAARIALKYRTPVFLLSDAYLANGSEPWLIPDASDLPDISTAFADAANHEGQFLPYLRDAETLARPWAIPGTPGLEHRIGGLEKADGTGNVSYDPDNHDHMVRIRARKVAGIVADIPELAVEGDEDADVLVAGWGGTYGPIAAAVRRIRGDGRKVAHAHFTHLNPLPRNTEEVLKRFDRVLVPEMNLGQLSKVLRAEFLVDAVSYNKVRGLPFTSGRARRGDRGAAVSENGQNGDGLIQLTAKDFKTDQEVRWCPGCGDYAILAAVQGFMPELGIPRERIVFISGIGCAARFPYYMETYGMHSIHGRAPAIATGLSSSRPDLSVWVVTGDGDALSIGGNHLIHALRRNVDITILMFNNQVYGLTKGQYSPTSPVGQRTGSTPMGSIDNPFNPLSVALGAEATFVARSIDTDRKHLTEVLRAAAAHKGAAFVEVYQNCNVYNDGAFDFVREDKENRIRLEHGQPIRFGAEDEKGVRLRADGSAEIVEVAEAGEEALLVHDAHAHEPSIAFALSRLTKDTVGAAPIGVFRDVERPVYDELLAAQIDAATEKSGPGDLAALLHAGDTWTID